MTWLASAFSAIGSIPVAILPDGVSYWLAMLGVNALIGGIITGITLAVSIQLIKFFAGKLLSVINPLG